MVIWGEIINNAVAWEIRELNYEVFNSLRNVKLTIPLQTPYITLQTRRRHNRRAHAAPPSSSSASRSRRSLSSVENTLLLSGPYLGQRIATVLSVET